MVRAKFRVIRIESTQQVQLIDPLGKWTTENTKDVEMRTIVMAPVTGTTEENKRFWNASPSGEIRLGTINQEAWKQFRLGGEYYIDFTYAFAGE